MGKKETLPVKLTKKQLNELLPLAKKIAGFRQQSIDIAGEIGNLNFCLWGKVHEMVPELANKRVLVDWDTGEVTEAKDC